MLQLAAAALGALFPAHIPGFLLPEHRHHHGDHIQTLYEQFLPQLERASHIEDLNALER